MKIRDSLRSRFVAAILLVVVLLSASFYLAVSHFIEYLEQELIGERLQQELLVFADEYRHAADEASRPSANTRRYLARSAQDPLPAPLATLSPGTHDDIRIDGQTYHVGRQDIDGARLFVAIEMDPVERLEHRLFVLTVTCSLLGLALSWLLARMLYGLVIRPVEQLAGLVAVSEPSSSPPQLASHFDHREMGIIASAFDRYAARAAQFIERERAFTEDASHEIRTPLTAILGAAQLLAADKQLDERAQRRVQRIRRASLQMRQTVDALLSLARGEQADGAEVEDCALDQVLTEVCQLRRETLVDSPVSLDLAIEAPQRVRAPAALVSSLIDNLIANAIAHAAQGRVQVRLQHGLLSVEDTGSGIAAEDLPRIFEHGYRGPSSRGFGLGLSLVARIAQRLGWRVAVSSRAGAGARFEVCFEAATGRSSP